MIDIRQSFLILALILAPLSSAQSQETAPGAQQAIRSVIESQLAAFQRDDGVKAFSFASPGIRRKFGTAETFMQMVKTGYPSVYRPREVEFRALRQRGDLLQQEVLFVGPDGQPLLALYTMEQQADGSWRIAGVVLIKAPDAMT